MAKKIKFQNATDPELLEACSKETGISDPESPVWQTTSTPQWRRKFPEKTIAVIVDVRQEVGALRIFDNETGKFLDGVGTEEKGKMVMVIWEDGWNYDAAGTVRLAYVLKP